MYKTVKYVSILYSRYYWVSFANIVKYKKFMINLDFVELTSKSKFSDFSGKVTKKNLTASKSDSIYRLTWTLLLLLLICCQICHIDISDWLFLYRNQPIIKVRFGTPRHYLKYLYNNIFLVLSVHETANVKW